MSLEQYSGKFWSTRYTAGLSRGNVWVELRPEAKEAYVADAKIKYLGMFRLGSKVDVKVNVLPDNKATSEKFETPNMSLRGRTVSRTEGTLTFQVESRTADTIKGTYSLDEPRDYGKFELKKGPDNVEQCLLM